MEDIKVALTSEGFDFVEIVDEDGDHSYFKRTRMTNKFGRETITINTPNEVRTRDGQIVMACWVSIISNLIEQEDDIEFEDVHEVDYSRFVRIEKLMNWVHNPLGY